MVTVLQQQHKNQDNKRVYTDISSISSGVGKDSTGQFRKQLRKTRTARPAQTYMTTVNGTPASYISNRKRDIKKKKKRKNDPKRLQSVAKRRGDETQW